MIIQDSYDDNQTGPLSFEMTFALPQASRTNHNKINNLSL